MDESQEPGSWRRFTRLKPNRKQIGKRARKLELATLRHARKFLIQRWANVREVRRHMLGWLVVVALMITATGLQFGWYRTSYTAATSVAGGTYAEGVVGPLEIINPLFASTNAELAATRLLFSGLLAYDAQNQLRNDLAQKWEVSPDGKTYTVTLRTDARWHDGQPVTSADVAFTVGLIKNPETRSPLRSSWQMIEAKVVNQQTVQFTLPEPYAPFPHALTFGLVPEHLLKRVAPGLLREGAFSKEPIGSGPFAFRNIQSLDATEGRKVVHLRAVDGYYGGKPKLDRLQLHIYKDQGQLAAALTTNEVGAATDISSSQSEQLSGRGLQVESFTMNNGTYALLRNDAENLKDRRVREALRFATNTSELLKRLPGATALNGPIINDQYQNVMKIKPPAPDVAQAERLLDEAGWKKGADGIREQGGRKLALLMVAVRSGDYELLAQDIATQWRKIGVEVDVRIVSPEDVQQNVLRPRAYDVLLYELAVGADPDVFAYWHSSQISSSGLNFANYSSQIADDALASARFRSETKLRAEKYKTFTEQWLRDVPAIALYRPVLRYAKLPAIQSITDRAVLNDAADRFREVKNWTVEQGVRYTTP